jgi:FixJ family two-component response regulator
MISGTSSQVMVVDDDPAVRRSLRRLLQASGYRVEVAASPEQVRCDGDGDVPRCMVLDVRMPGTSGVQYHQALAAKGSDMPIVFLTGHADVATSVRAMKNGAVDFLTKPVQEAELLDAVSRALRRDAEGMAHRRKMASLRARYTSLTPREQQVLAVVTAGNLNKEAALELGISEKTIKVHRGRVMAKMAAPSLADLVRFAEALGVGKNEGRASIAR